MRIDSTMVQFPRGSFHTATGSSNSPPTGDGFTTSPNALHKPGWVKPTVPVISDGDLRVYNSGPNQAQSDSSNMPMLTMEGMIAAFGTNDATFDLNADGIVDIQDLSQFLINGNLMPHPDAPLTTEGFNQALGSTNSAYDLDGDGHVTTNDFSQWLLNYGQSHTSSSTFAPQTPGNEKGSAPPNLPANSPLSIRGSTLFGQQAMQLYEQLWNHSSNTPPRQLLFGA